MVPLLVQGLASGEVTAVQNGCTDPKNVSWHPNSWLFLNLLNYQWATKNAGKVFTELYLEMDLQWKWGEQWQRHTNSYWEVNCESLQNKNKAKQSKTKKSHLKKSRETKMITQVIIAPQLEMIVWKEEKILQRKSISVRVRETDRPQGYWLQGGCLRNKASSCIYCISIFSLCRKEVKAVHISALPTLLLEWMKSKAALTKTAILNCSSLTAPPLILVFCPAAFPAL